MQLALRPYATAGVALVGASIIVVTPVAPPLPEIQAHSVKLVDAWTDLVSDTTANLSNIAANSDPTAIAGVFQALLSNPLGVIQALTDLTPTVTTELGSLPATVNIELPPGLELGIAQLGAWATTLESVNEVVGQLSSNPAGAFNTLLEAPATILNGFLNGEDNISLLDGTINIAGFNGILAPLQEVSISLNLANLLDALGVGDLSLSSLGINLTDLLNQLGLGNLDLGGLFDALGIGNDGLGSLLTDATLSSLLGDLGLSGLGLGSFSLTQILSDLGLNGATPLNELGLSTVLDAFGLDSPINLSLSGLLTDLGFGSLVNEGLGSLLATLPSGLLTGALSSLNGVLGTLLNPLLSIPALGPLLSSALTAAGLNLNSLLDVSNLETALNGITIGDLLGGQGIDTTVSGLLGDLGIDIPDNLTVGGILTDLGFASGTADLTLSGLLTDLGIGDTGIGGLLNTVSLSDLLGDLGLSDLPLNLSNLGDLTDLTVGGLLGDLGLGDIATINIDGFGGLATLLSDVIPQQILTSLGM